MSHMDDDTTESQVGVDDPSLYEDEEIAITRFNITSYGADYPVDALIKRLHNKAIVIPEFQRGYVWTLPQASRFVESLLLGLPVPAIFLSKDPETGKLIVIDGQQRLTSLYRFYTKIFEGREFKLKGVDPEFEGKTIDDLEPDVRLNLDDSLLHAIIVNQTEPEGDSSGLYSIFERINTGGTALQPQEIRACVFHGAFIDLLHELVTVNDWQEIYGKPSKRAKDEELILRFFTLLYNRENYKRPMKKFLNDFISWNRHCDKISADELRGIFTETSAVVNNVLGPKSVRPTRNLNAALLDAVFVGIAEAVRSGSVASDARLIKAYEGLLEKEDFCEAFEKATTDEKNVDLRIQYAIEAFSDERE